MDSYDEELKGVVVLTPMDCSLVDFARAIRVCIAEEQDKLNPDNALIATLCNAARLGREHLDYVNEANKKMWGKIKDV